MNEDKKSASQNKQTNLNSKPEEENKTEEINISVGQEDLADKSIISKFREGKKFFKGRSADEDFEEKYKRALADYQNLLKRTAREKEEFARYANEQLVREILPVYEHLKLALVYADKENHNQWLEGVKQVINQFQGILKNIGVEEIEAQGKKFDPSKMDALEGRGEKVKKEVRPGYLLNGKVIISAKVILE